MKAPGALLASVLVILVGCSATPVVDLADSSPTPTAVSSPQDGTIVLTGSELVIYPRDGSSTMAISYTSDPAQFERALTELFGFEPQFSHHETAGDCDPTYDRYAWGGFALITNSAWIPDAYKVELNSSVAAESGIAIVSSLGVGVGDDDSTQRDLADSTTTAIHEGHVYRELYYDVTPSSFIGGDGESYDGEMGGLLAAVDDEVYVLAAPVIVGAGSSC